MWATLALSTVLTWTPAQQGKLATENVRAVEWVLGPPRKDPDNVLPGDLYVLAFDVVGLKVKQNGEVRYSTSMKLTRKGQQKPDFEQPPQDYEGVNTLGGARIPVTSIATIGTDTKPGKLTMTVTVKDRLADTETTVTQDFEVLPRKFGIVRTSLTNMPAGQQELIYMPPVACLGQSLLLNFTLAGYALDSSDDPDMVLTMTIFDEDGKATLGKPPGKRFTKTSDDWKKHKVHICQYPIEVNRAGKFKIVIEATDKVSGKSDKRTMNLTVLEVK
jgi:hypothetical protein